MLILQAPSVHHRGLLLPFGGHDQFHEQFHAIRPPSSVLDLVLILLADFRNYAGLSNEYILGYFHSKP